MPIKTSMVAGSLTNFRPKALLPADCDCTGGGCEVSMATARPMLEIAATQ